LLDGFEIDQEFAVTGDITINWKTRVVGAISSKIRGASLDDYKYVIVPADNEPQVFEIPLLDSTKAVWKIQILDRTRWTTPSHSCGPIAPPTCRKPWTHSPKFRHTS